MKNWKILLLMPIVALFGFAGAYSLFSLGKKEENSHGRLVFELQAQDVLLSLKEQISKNNLILSGIRSFFASSDSVTPTEWATYYKTLNLNSQFPAIEFIAIVRNISKEAEEREIQKIRAEGIPTFKIWPSSQGPELCPIVYIEPDPYADWVGYDTCQHPSIYSAMRQSTGKPEPEVVLAPAFSLRKVESRKADFTFWLPIEKKTKTNGGIKKEMYGWAMAFIRFDSLVKQVIQDVNLEDINLRVYFGNNPQPSDLIFASIMSPDNQPLYKQTKILDIAGSKFTFDFESGPSFKLRTSYFHPVVIFILSCGAVLSLLLVLYYIGSHEGVLHRKISEIRGELNLSLSMRQAILDNANYSIICTDKKGIIVLYNKSAEKLLGYTAQDLVGKETPVLFHDPEELKTRAQLLTNLLGKPIPAGMEVFTTMADKGIPDENDWVYIRKDRKKIIVHLSVTPLKTPQGELLGYMGIARETK